MFVGTNITSTPFWLLHQLIESKTYLIALGKATVVKHFLRQLLTLVPACLFFVFIGFFLFDSRVSWWRRCNISLTLPSKMGQRLAFYQLSPFLNWTSYQFLHRLGVKDRTSLKIRMKMRYRKDLINVWTILKLSLHKYHANYQKLSVTAKTMWNISNLQSMCFVSECLKLDKMFDKIYVKCAHCRTFFFSWLADFFPGPKLTFWTCKGTYQTNQNGCLKTDGEYNVPLTDGRAFVRQFLPLFIKMHLYSPYRILFATSVSVSTWITLTFLFQMNIYRETE